METQSRRREMHAMSIELSAYEGKELNQLLSEVPTTWTPAMLASYRLGVTRLFQWLGRSGVINANNFERATLEMNIQLDMAYNQANNRLDQYIDGVDY